MVRLEAAWRNITCTQLRKKVLLSLPPGSVLKSWRRQELTYQDGTKVILPWIIAAVPESTAERLQLWSSVRSLKADGIDCFIHPPGTYAKAAEEIAEFRRHYPSPQLRDFAFEVAVSRN